LASFPRLSGEQDMPMIDERTFPLTLEAAREVIRQDPLAQWIRFTLEALELDYVRARMRVDPRHVAPTGFLHAAVVTAFADITCGLGASLSLPDREATFATLEIKTNLLGTVRQGELLCEARPRHLGSSTQVWDAEAKDTATGKITLLFRCTQMILSKRE
jgi:uncharacterized protein (TIGR00369 family)